MKEEDIIALLALQHTPNIGAITAKKLIAHCGSPSAIYTEKKHKIAHIERIGSATLQHLFDPIHRKEAEKEWLYIQEHRMKYLTYFDEDYPTNLKNIIDAPILFFFEGDINLKNKKTLSIVGTRDMTLQGGAFCQKFVEELSALSDLVIISGFAYGVDIAAHKAAMENGLQTIACLAHGLDMLYPSAHKKYRNQLLENGGFITEFWHKSTFDRKNFLSRNRIIAGLSDATVVIESARKGGSLVTADLAFSYDREVFAIPGRPDDPYSQGCNFLIKNDKARLITSAADLIYYMGWEVSSIASKEVATPIFVELSPEEEKIVQVLKAQEKLSLDDLARACELPIHKLSNLLFQMEMKGVIRPLPGKIFSLAAIL